jgi:hypothetical protein
MLHRGHGSVLTSSTDGHEDHGSVLISSINCHGGHRHAYRAVPWDRGAGLLHV